MGRGREAGGTGNIDSLRRKQARRTDAARTQRARREKQRAAERKHTRSFLSQALSVAKRQAREIGAEVRVDQKGGGGGLMGGARWTEASIDLVSSSVSVWFSPGEEGGGGNNCVIDVRVAGRRVSNCPPELLQSGDRRAFVSWFEGALRAAVDRAQRGG